MRYLRKILLPSFLLLLSGCGGVPAMLALSTDPLLPKVDELKALPSMSSVGFEWQKVEDPRIIGFNVYRGVPGQGNQSLKRIGSAPSRYSTHFVDTDAKPNTEYIYALTTVSVGGESLPGKIVRVKTLPPFKPLSFVKSYKVASDAIKILWTPHRNLAVSGYVIERKTNGGPWRYHAEVKGRLMPEYIDVNVRSGNAYGYRVRAKSFDGIVSEPTRTDPLAL